MLANRGYAAYANNKVTTASPADLVLMLYEGAIKFCNIAIVAIENKEIEICNQPQGRGEDYLDDVLELFEEEEEK